MFHVLKKPSFGALTLSQFLGAFNDNAFKTLVLLLVAPIALGTETVGWVEGSWLAQTFGQSLPSTLFALPFVLFGPLTGSLADRVSKTRIVQAANLIEVFVMVSATVTFVLQDYDVLLLTVFLMGTQSAIFGPSKYGIIKELVGERDLGSANAMIQASTMVAILGGSVVGGFFADTFQGVLWVAGIWYVGFALLGWGASLKVHRVPAADPTRQLSWNPVREFLGHWRATEGDRNLVLSLIASAAFYLVAALFVNTVLAYGKYLGLPDTKVGALNAFTILGIVVGSTLAGRACRTRTEGGLVPLGLLGMAAGTLLIWIDPHSVWVLRASLLALGVASGLFTVPVRCLIQGLPKEGQRGSVQGLAETLDFVGILLAGPLFYLMDKGLELTPPQMFLFGTGLLVVMSVLSVVFAGEFLVRVVLLVLTNTLYRLRVVGQERVPEHRGALLISNHVSFVDAILIAAAAGRPVRFLMYRDFFDLPLVGWFARRMGTIPISSRDGREAREEALHAAAEAVRRGELVCIFAEGAITRTGSLLAFAPGLERIAQQMGGAPIVPVALDRLWGSLFSFHGGKAFWKMPRRLLHPVDVAFGEPLPADTSAAAVRLSIQERIADLRATRGGPRGSLAYRFVVSAKQHARRTAVVDTTGKRLTYRRLLIGSLALRRLLARELGPAERVALLVPPTAGGALCNVALTLARRTSVNLNYTLSNEALQAPLRTAGCEQVITSRRFLKALGRRSPLPEERTLYLEDLATRVTGGDKLRATLLSLLPTFWLARHASPQEDADEIATVIFSSGSTGEPKGVQLSHGNVLSNVQSVLQVLAFGPGDAMLGVLPFFHSFGYTVTLWSVLLSGAKALYHPNPLETDAIGELARDEGATLAVGTPAFYQSWLRRCPPEAFAKLRLAVCGAQKLPRPLAEAWERRVGIPLLEGYGATELSPVVSCNLPDPEGESPRHRGLRPGTVGRPLPGVVVRAVDVDTGAPLSPGKEGLLQVKGPNVMRGYLGREDATAEVLRGGWYVTGDIGRVEPDGFVVLTDRLSRFSKIGGEMVPHGRIEEELHAILARHLPPGALDAGVEGDGPEVVVTAVEDERKGEQLVVLCAHLPVAPETLADELARTDLPALFQPKRSMYLTVDAIPRLGTGKTDLRAVRDLATERVLGVRG